MGACGLWVTVFFFFKKKGGGAFGDIRLILNTTHHKWMLSPKNISTTVFSRVIANMHSVSEAEDILVKKK